jgi:HSP20 family protein
VLTYIALSDRPSQYMHRWSVYKRCAGQEVFAACRQYRVIESDAFPGEAQGGNLMDPFSKKLLEELEQMQQHTGRILRSRSLARMMPVGSEGWQPAVDIYEANGFIHVYAELAGVVSDSLRVTVDGLQLQIGGVRQLPSHRSIACIHQLEIELGSFQRALTLPSAVEVEGVESSYINGILLVTLPKQTRKSRVTIRVTPGE